MKYKKHEAANIIIQHNAINVKNTELDSTGNLKYESIYEEK